MQLTVLQALLANEKPASIYTPDADADLQGQLRTLGAPYQLDAHPRDRFDMAITLRPVDARAMIHHSDLVVIDAAMSAARFADLAEAFERRSFVHEMQYPRVAVFRKVPKGSVMRHYAQAVWDYRQQKENSETALLPDIEGHLATVREQVAGEVAQLQAQYQTVIQEQAREIATLRYERNRAQAVPGYRAMAGAAAAGERLFAPESRQGRLRGTALLAVRIIRKEGVEGIVARVRRRWPGKG